MKRKFIAEITYNVKESHPDLKYIENPSESLTFKDTYFMDVEYWENNTEEMICFIKNDIALVAGGGYSKEHIENVSYAIR